MIEKMTFPVPLTDQELITAANYSAMLTQKLREKEEEFATIRANFKNSIQDLKQALSLQMDLLINKREERDVEVEILFNTPEEGKKTFRDPVTQEVWEIADMTEDDKEDLFVNAEVSSRQEEDEEEEPVPYPSNEDADTRQRRAGIPKFTGNTMAAALEEEEGTPSEVCSVCKECHSVLHISADKPICGICREEKNKENLLKIDELAKFWQSKKVQPAFRVIFGFGCIPTKRDTTCFRFMLESGSWGNPVYLAGDYTYTNSQSFNFYKELVKHGWREA